MFQVCVVTGTFERAHTLPRAIASVAAQSLARWRHIIVDDGSTDATAALLAPLADDTRYTCVRQENRGYIATMNRGAALATSTYLAFLDSDDAFLPHHLASSIATLEAGADLVWGAAQGTGPLEAQLFDDVERPGMKVHVSDCCVSPTIVVRTSLWQALGGYRDVLSPDNDFKARALAAQARVLRRKEPSVVVHCEGDDRLSRSIRALTGRDAGDARMPEQALVRAHLRKK